MINFRSSVRRTNLHPLRFISGYSVICFLFRKPAVLFPFFGKSFHNAPRFQVQPYGNCVPGNRTVETGQGLPDDSFCIPADFRKSFALTAFQALENGGTKSVINTCIDIFLGARTGMGSGNSCIFFGGLLHAYRLDWKNSFISKAHCSFNTPRTSSVFGWKGQLVPVVFLYPFFSSSAPYTIFPSLPQ